MKTRIISGLVGVLILIGVLYGLNTIFFVAVISLFSMLATYEILRVSKIDNKFLLAAGLIYAGAYPWLSSLFESEVATILQVVFFVLLLITMVVKHKTIQFQQFTITALVPMMISFAFACFIFLRDLYITYPGEFTREEGWFFVLMVMVSAWCSDTGAYFTGKAIGKRKLTDISPKKTVEGFIGGVVIAVLCNVLLLFAFNRYIFLVKNISYLTVIVIALVLALLGVVGDLSASTIKRNYGAKDFGKIMPGHGGVMDRFDSILLIAPILYALVQLMRIIIR